MGRETRETAEEAASRAGVTLGEWLDDVVANQAAKRALDSDERLEAIGARLDRLSRREDPQIDPARGVHLRDELADEARPRRALRQPNADGRQLVEELLEAAISKFEGRVAQTSERTTRALGSVATWIEHSRDRRREERESLDALGERLDSFEDRMNQLAHRLDAEEKARGEPQRVHSRVNIVEAVGQIARRREELDSRVSAPGDEHANTARRDLRRTA